MGLLDELKLDIERLGKRNLGRDDRVISHWGREARFPYLDEALVKWAVESPIWQKCDFQSNVLAEREIPNLEPGKKVLRLLAYELGMHSVAQEKKRAVRLPFSLGMISLTANRFNLGQGRRRWNWVIQKAQR
jgi:asparagine synthetase B (glutamine-hydrolysing)